eukprot:Em0014g245a
MLGATWLLLFAVLCSSGWATAIPSDSGVYSFGPGSGDKVLPRGADSDSGFLNLSVPFPFYGKTRRFISVNNKGLVLFEDISSADYIYSFVFPFGAHVDTTSAGQVYYRVVNDGAVLNNTTNQVKTAFFGQYPDFKPTLVFIATWFQVGYYNAHSIPNNTYQAVLLTNGTLSFSIFIYPPSGIQWITSDRDEGANGFGAEATIVGFVNDTGHPDLLPGSGRSSMRLLSVMSNVNMSGVWVFRIDRAIAGPLMNECAVGYLYCDQNADCIDRQHGFLCVCKSGFNGDGKACARNEGSGAEANQGSCVAGKHTKCCYGNQCQAGDCYCDPACYFQGDCCDDITTTCPLNAFDVLVNFQVSEIQVQEHTRVSVCIQSWSVRVQQQPVLALVTTHDGTAREGRDYGGRVYPLNLHGNGTTCVRSEVYGDQVIRDDRYFSFRFASDSDLVRSSVNTTIVWIMDSSTANVVFTRSMYAVQRGQVISVCALLNGTSERPVEVTFTSSPGTALDGVDYVGYRMRMTFPIGVQPVTCVEYQTLVSNGNVKSVANFTVTLTSTDKAVRGTPLDVLVTINSVPTTGGLAHGTDSVVIIVASIGGVVSFLIILVALAISVVCVVSQVRRYSRHLPRTFSSNRKSVEVKSNDTLPTECPDMSF